MFFLLVPFREWYSIEVQTTTRRSEMHFVGLQSFIHGFDSSYMSHEIKFTLLLVFFFFIFCLLLTVYVTRCVLIKVNESYKIDVSLVQAVIMPALCFLKIVGKKATTVQVSRVLQVLQNLPDVRFCNFSSIDKENNKLGLMFS